jgi:hypothetical protein
MWSSVTPSGFSFSLSFSFSFSPPLFSPSFLGDQVRIFVRPVTVFDGSNRCQHSQCSMQPVFNSTFTSASGGSILVKLVQGQSYMM